MRHHLILDFMEVQQKSHGMVLCGWQLVGVEVGKTTQWHGRLTERPGLETKIMHLMVVLGMGLLPKTCSPILIIGQIVNKLPFYKNHNFL